jgi:hypothetical protein|tara:strand:+ start:779 stop:1024 length:246 start_codon:yes stop_codon:yes gene_type:complete
MKKENSNWDTYDFQDWVVRNIHLILVDKQLDLFIKNNLGYEDLKLFGKMQEAENLKNDYQARAVTQVLTGGSLNMQWTSIN